MNTAKAKRNVLIGTGIFFALYAGVINVATASKKVAKPSAPKQVDQCQVAKKAIHRLADNVDTANRLFGGMSKTQLNAHQQKVSKAYHAANAACNGKFTQPTELAQPVQPVQHDWRTDDEQRLDNRLAKLGEQCEEATNPQQCLTQAVATDYQVQRLQSRINAR